MKLRHFFSRSKYNSFAVANRSFISMNWLPMNANAREPAADCQQTHARNARKALEVTMVTDDERRGGLDPGVASTQFVARIGTMNRSGVVGARVSMDPDCPRAAAPSMRA